MEIKSGKNTFKIKRKPAGEVTTLYGSPKRKGTKIEDIACRPPACITHDYSDVIGWNKRDYSQTKKETKEEQEENKINN